MTTRTSTPTPTSTRAPSPTDTSSADISSGPTRKHWLGITEVIISGICFGFLGFFGKKGYELGIRGGELMAFRFAISAICLFALLLAFKPALLRPSRQTIIKSLLLGACGYTLFPLFFFEALKGISASLTVLLTYTYPIFVSIGGWFLFKEALGRSGILAIVMTSLGLVGLVWGEWRISSAAYVIFGILSGFTYACCILTSRAWFQKINGYTSTFYIQVGFGVAIVCGLLAMGLFLSGLRHLKGSEAAILSTTEPLTGVIIAALFPGERLGPVQIAGGILVISA